MQAPLPGSLPTRLRNWWAWHDTRHSIFANTLEFRWLAPLSLLPGYHTANHLASYYSDCIVLLPCQFFLIWLSLSYLMGPDSNPNRAVCYICTTTAMTLSKAVKSHHKATTNKKDTKRESIHKVWNIIVAKLYPIPNILRFDTVYCKSSTQLFTGNMDPYPYCIGVWSLPILYGMSHPVIHLLAYMLRL
jgi:hypothetical protein